MALGSRATALGRMASCASCALFFARYIGGASGKYSRPRRSVTHARASACASERDPHRVRAHVGDEPDLALVPERDALVELLGEHHRLLRGEVQLAPRLLLEGRRDERRGGIAPALAPRDRLDRPGLAVEVGHHGERRRFRGELGLLPAHFAEGRHELGRRLAPEPRVKRPVLDRDERLDLALPLGDETDGDGLHAPGREPAAHLLPEQRRQLVPHQAIEHAARLLGIHLVRVDLAWLQERRSHRAFRDLVEQDAMGLGLRKAQLLRQMPPDGLALAIGIGRDVERLGVGRGLLQLLEHLLLRRQHLVFGLEALLLVDAELGLRQVADVPHRRLDEVLRIQILLDRLDLGG